MNTDFVMTGECTEDQFWAEVERIGWKDKNPPCSSIVERDLLARWDDDFIRTARDLFRDCQNRLYATIERYEEEHNVSCECSDDSFSDLTAHIVGLGKAEFEATLKDPMRAVRRGRKHRYVESFAYCLPYDRPAEPKLTFEEAKLQALNELMGDYDWDPERKRDVAPTPELSAHAEMMAFSKMLGERAKLDPRYYAAWAKRELPDLQALMNSGFAKEFKTLPYVLECTRKIADGKIAEVVDEGHEYKKAVTQLREEREAMLAELNDMLAPHGWSLDNMASDGLCYIGDEGRE